MRVSSIIVTPMVPSASVRSVSIANTASPGLAAIVVFWRTMNARPVAILTWPAGVGCWAKAGTLTSTVDEEGARRSNTEHETLPESSDRDTTGPRQLQISTTTYRTVPQG